jgi:hypothetical protein
MAERFVIAYHHSERMARQQVANNEFSQNIETNLNICNSLYDPNWDCLVEVRISALPRLRHF